MRVEVYSIQRNEARILPYFLRHYSSFADRIVIFDDMSTDGSPDLIRACARAELREYPCNGIDDYRFRDIYREESRKSDADWVICVDGDEFVYHPQILEVLATEKAKGTQFIFCEGWNMFADAFPQGDGQIYDEVATGMRDPWYDKPVAFSPTLDMAWTLGRHNIHHMPGITSTRDSGIKMLHYHYLGREYCEQRLELNFDRFANDKIRAKHGRHVHGDIYLHSLKWYEDHREAAVRCV